MKKPNLRVMISLLGATALLYGGISSALADIAATHVYHNHMPNFWPYYDVTKYSSLAVGAPIRYTYDAQVIDLKNAPPASYTYYLPNGSPMPHDDLVSYYTPNAKTGAYMSWPMSTATQNRNSYPQSQTQVTMSAAVVNNVQSLNERGNVSGYNDPGWGEDWRYTYDNVRTTHGLPALDLIHFSGHHSMGPLVGNEYFLKDLLYHNVTLAQSYFLGGSFKSSKGFFPTELGFSTRIIPALKKLGIEWSVLGNVHYSRALRDYPYLNDPGVDTVTSPPNRADMRNSSSVGRWVSIQMFNEKQVTQNKFPFASIPHYVAYVDPTTGARQTLAGIPVEQAGSWEEGYQGSITAAAIKPFESDAAGLGRTQYFVIAHDGDNSSGRAGDGGTWANSGYVTYADSGVKGKGVGEYLIDHPIPANDIVHVQDGSWIDTRDSSADPTWYHWHLPMCIWQGQFSTFNQVMGTSYAPKKNYAGVTEGATVSFEYGYHYLERNFALLQAALNTAKTAEQIWLDGHPGYWQPSSALDKQVTYAGNQLNPWMMSYPVKGDAARDYAGGANPAELAWYFLIPAMDSGFGYYDENQDDNVKPTIAFNESLFFSEGYVLPRLDQDRTGPSIWWPQRYPYNPGSANISKAEGWTLHYFDNHFGIYTYGYDVNGVQSIKVRIRTHRDKWADVLDKTYQVYDPASLSGDPDIHLGNVGSWVDYPMKRRDLTPDINGVPWQSSTQQVMKTVPARKIGDLFYAYIGDYRDQLLDYYIEATDGRGNVTRSEIQQVYVGAGRFRQDAASGKIVEDLNGPILGTYPFVTDKAPTKSITLYIEGSGVDVTRIDLESSLAGTDEWSDPATLAPLEGAPDYFRAQLSYTTDYAGLEVRYSEDGLIYLPDEYGVLLTAGTWTLYADGVLEAGPPPDVNFVATVYYKTPYGSSTYMHYRPAGGTWTTSPGKLMPASEYAGYTVMDVDLGLIDTLEAVFNNGAGVWDNNGGKNYLFPAGVSTLETGKITAGFPVGTAGNRPPVANAGADITVTQGQSVKFDGTGSSDPDGTIASYQWSNGLSGATPSKVYDTVGTFTVTLTVTDNAGAMATDTVVVTVKSNVNNVMTVYYKRGYATPYLHHRKADNTWTASPGDVMPVSTVNGYNMLAVSMGSLTSMEAVFNSGTGTWDNNGGKNYFFPVGVSTFDGGKITAGVPTPVNVAPVAAVTPASSTITAGASLTFYGTGSYDPDGAIVAYKWSNGTTSSTATMAFPTAGTFTVSLTVTDTAGATATASSQVTVKAAGYARSYNQLYFRGTANNWGTTAMALVADNQWQVDVTFAGSSTDRFKLDVNGDWAVNFGDTNKDGVAEQGGADIYITAGGGGYRLSFNDLSRKYTVTKTSSSYAKAYSQLYFRGTPNAWATTGMALVADHLWEVKVTFAGTTSDAFKFDVNGDWSLNFGDTNKDGVAEQSGANIAVTGGGSRTIRFNDSTRAYTVVSP